jgi:hypothetical protein
LITTLKYFNEVDSDHDGITEKEELADLAKDPEFSDNDFDKSGGLSVLELVKEKLGDFDVADTNSDGLLSLDEVKKYYER